MNNQNQSKNQNPTQNLNQNQNQEQNRTVFGFSGEGVFYTGNNGIPLFAASYEKYQNNQKKDGSPDSGKKGKWLQCDFKRYGNDKKQFLVVGKMIDNNSKTTNYEVKESSNYKEVKNLMKGVDENVEM